MTDYCSENVNILGKNYNEDVALSGYIQKIHLKFSKIYRMTCILSLVRLAPG